MHSAFLKFLFFKVFYADFKIAVKSSLSFNLIFIPELPSFSWHPYLQFTHSRKGKGDSDIYAQLMICEVIIL